MTVRAFLMRALSGLIIAMLSIGLVGDVLADGPSDIDKKAARTSLDQGDERMRAKDYEGALEAYTRADDIMGVPTTSIEVGKAALALGRLVLAYEAFSRTAKYSQKKPVPKPFVAAQKEAKDLAAKVKPRIPRLELEVDGVGPDIEVEVLIDEEPIDAWGGSMGIDPGAHDITATAVGYEPASEQIVLSEGERRTLTLTLIPVSKPDQPAPKADADNLWWTVALVSLPLGGASLIAGGVTGGLSLSQAAEVKDECVEGRCPDSVSDKLSSSTTLAHVSTVTLIVGGVAAAVGIAAITIALSGDDDDADVGDESEESEESEELEAMLVVRPTDVTLTISF